MIEFRPVLRRDETAAVIQPALYERITRVESPLRLNIDYETDQTVLSRRRRVESQVIMDCVFIQGRVFGIRADYLFTVPVRRRLTDFRLAFDVLVYDVIYRAVAVFLDAAFHYSR